MGVEAVHRAFAHDLRGVLGNDRMFMKFDDLERAPVPRTRARGDSSGSRGAVAQLQAAGIGFGAQGATPGKFYDFDTVKRRTPPVPDVNSREIE